MQNSKEELRAAARLAMDDKVKPLGSLGMLEEWAVQLAVLQGTLTPRIDRARILIFAADHGVSAEGVSAYPREVTLEMTRTFSSGGAAINVLSRAAGLEVEVTDVGVDGDLSAMPGLVHAKVRRGTRSFLREPALTPAEWEAAAEAGRQAVRRAAEAGAQAVGLGEMGIGNTTAAAALLSGLTGAAPEDTVGRGTGVTDEILRHKREVVQGALRLHAGPERELRTLVAALGGLEMAAIAGAAQEGARRGLAVLVDGFISTVAVLSAVRLDPTIRPALFFAHRSAERGHRIALETLDARPLLDLDMRLGEGTGAALALPILKAAADLMRDMATFSQAGVSTSEPAPALR
ncbi:MAG TPA: nicotinate-nucleotide--dimethylbenzimidazole phosphoribosyltransferase [Thermoanaerobaculia bacterium]|jgi:nicotinate-nucleotide--dimethylbenzimidazole phosphoribosyltransferase